MEPIQLQLSGVTAGVSCMEESPWANQKPGNGACQVSGAGGPLR